MQRRLNNRLAARDGKVELLEIYWDKILMQFAKMADKNKDQKGKLMNFMIASIPRKVKIDILKKYISSCNDLMAIAFF